MAKETMTIWRCDLCGKQGDHYSTIGFNFCGYHARRECCKECRRSFDDWRESRKPKPTPAPPADYVAKVMARKNSPEGQQAQRELAESEAKAPAPCEACEWERQNGRPIAAVNGKFHTCKPSGA